MIGDLDLMAKQLDCYGYEVRKATPKWKYLFQLFFQDYKWCRKMLGGKWIGLKMSSVKDPMWLWVKDYSNQENDVNFIKENYEV